jgi:hypothetical protein
VSSRIVLLIPDANGKPTYRVITAYVQEILMEALVRRRWDDLEQTFRQFTAIPELDTVEGWLWEGYCKMMLPTMAALDVKDVVTVGQVLHLSDMPRNVIRIYNAKETTEDVGFYIPAVRNQATFDAISITADGKVIVFRMTKCLDLANDEIVEAFGKKSELLP